MDGTRGSATAMHAQIHNQQFQQDKDGLLTCTEVFLLQEQHTNV